MSKLKYIFQEKKMLIIIISIILICSIAIAFGVYAQITNKGSIKKDSENENTNYEELKSNFQEIFTDSINKETTANAEINYDELLYLKYDIKEEKVGKYNVTAKIPGFKEDTETLKKINQEIYDVFAREILKIAADSSTNSTFNLDYVGYVNNNIISLAIMCKYKKGANAQRRIVQTYNYDVENDKLLTIDDIVKYKNLNKEEMNKKIENEIKNANSKSKKIVEQGFNVYVRDEDSQIYEVENTPNFFLGKNNYLYLVYAYGNDNYTDVIDLVIF